MNGDRPVAIVTGSSRGIGAATALRLASDGYAVCVNYRANADAARSVLEQVNAKDAGGIVVQADMAVEDDIVAMFEQVDRELGIPRVLVNNAGILDTQCRVVDLTAERINRILRTNVTGYFLCCREAVRRMSTRHGGSGGVIVNVSSAAARIGSPREYVDYAASKGAVDTLTIGLAGEVADEGIRVNAVRPGLIDTDMHIDGGEPDRVNRMKDRIPMKRGGTAEEVAAAIAWLVSEESAYTTGSLVDVTGGR